MSLSEKTNFPKAGQPGAQDRDKTKTTGTQTSIYPTLPKKVSPSGIVCPSSSLFPVIYEASEKTPAPQSFGKVMFVDSTFGGSGRSSEVFLAEMENELRTLLADGVPFSLMQTGAETGHPMLKLNHKDEKWEVESTPVTQSTSLQFSGCRHLIPGEKWEPPSSSETNGWWSEDYNSNWASGEKLRDDGKLHSSSWYQDRGTDNDYTTAPGKKLEPSASSETNGWLTMDYDSSWESGEKWHSSSWYQDKGEKCYRGNRVSRNGEDEQSYVSGNSRSQRSIAFSSSGQRVLPKYLCKFPIGIKIEEANGYNFDLRKKILGSGGKNLKCIIAQTEGVKLRLRGQGSGFFEDNGQESEERLVLHLSALEKRAYSRVKADVTKLLDKVYFEFYKLTDRRVQVTALEHPLSYTL